MKISHSFDSLIRHIHNRTPLHQAGRLAASLCLTAGLCMPGWAMADEANASDSAQDVALLQSQITPATAEPVIRLKLHGIERLTDEPARPAAPASTAIDELKKEAQSRYLAKKLRQREAAVRQYVDLAWAEASKRDALAPELLIAIIQKESTFRPKVQSRYGAQGLMQVVRRWHRDKLHPSESLFDPVVNIRVGADVLEEYLALAGGNLDNALRKYSGNARGYANTILKESRRLARIAEQATAQAQVAQG